VTTPAIFAFDSNAVRVHKDANGDPWFIATDVCQVLTIANSRDALSRLDDDERGSTITDTPGGRQELATINESGLYTLILRSRKPEAKRFKKWVTSEVLPSIRKTGGYNTTQSVDLVQATILLGKTAKALREAGVSKQKALIQALEAVHRQTGVRLLPEIAGPRTPAQIIEALFNKAMRSRNRAYPVKDGIVRYAHLLTLSKMTASELRPLLQRAIEDGLVQPIAPSPYGGEAFRFTVH
jgi:prophage antirepressor-like protein